LCFSVHGNGGRGLRHRAEYLRRFRVRDVHHALQFGRESAALLGVIEAAGAKGILGVVAQLKKVGRDRRGGSGPGCRG
jgi:hypothetical protein